MGHFRENLLKLGFVKETKDGLDYWAVTTTSCPRRDREAGRLFGARFVDFVAEHDSPFVAFHVTQAWRAARYAGTSEVIRGFIESFGRPLLVAPDATTGCAAAAVVPVGLPGRAAGASWETAPTGVEALDLARGREMGEAIAEAVRKAGTTDALQQVSLASRHGSPAQDSPDLHVRIGILHALSECVIEARRAVGRAQPQRDAA